MLPPLVGGIGSKSVSSSSVTGSRQSPPPAQQISVDRVFEAGTVVPPTQRSFEEQISPPSSEHVFIVGCKEQQAWIVPGQSYSFNICPAEEVHTVEEDAQYFPADSQSGRL